MVIIRLVAGNWRVAGKKKQLYRLLADNLAANPGGRQEDVMVVPSPNERDDWSSGNGLASYLKENDAT